MTRRAQGRGRSRPLWAGGGIPHALRAAWSFALPTGEIRRVLWHRNGASGWPFGDAGTEGQPGFTYAAPDLKRVIFFPINEYYQVLQE